MTCQYDLSCGTLTASSIYGGASTQIISAINSAVSTKQDTIDNSTDLNVNTLTSSSDVVINGNILANGGRTSVWRSRLNILSGAICDQAYVTCSTSSCSVANVYSFVNTM